MRCSVQNYAWGIRGKGSEVGRLYSLQSKLPLEEEKPYAELWMGTHDSGPSFVVIEHDHDDGVNVNGSVSDGGMAHVNSSHSGEGLNPHVDDINGGNSKKPIIVEGSNGIREESASLAQDVYDNNCNTEMLLKDWLSRNPSFLGDKVLQKWGVNLPFLFKVRDQIPLDLF